MRNVDDDNYIKALLKIAVERGIPVLFRDSDGYMKAITKDNLSKIGMDGFTNLHVDMNSMKSIVEALEHDSGVVAGKYAPNYFLHGGEVQSVGNATISDEDKLFDGSLDTYMHITSDEHNLPSGVVLTLPQPIVAKSVTIYKVKSSSGVQGMACAATSGVMYFRFSLLDSNDEEITYRNCGCTNNSTIKIDLDGLHEIAKIKVVQIHNYDCPHWGIRRIDVDTTPYLMLVDKSGSYINPAKESTLSAINGNINTKLSTRASEATLGQVLSQLQSLLPKPTNDHFVAEIDVGTTAVQADADTLIRDEITIYADKNNSDIVMLGNSDSNLVFPLNAGDIFTIKKASLSKIWFIANSGTQKVYVDAGGGW